MSENLLPIDFPCSDKISFETKREAMATAATSAYWYGTKPSPYRCMYCNLWHLSSSSTGE